MHLLLPYSSCYVGLGYNSAVRRVTWRVLALVTGTWFPLCTGETVLIWPCCCLYQLYPTTACFTLYSLAVINFLSVVSPAGLLMPSASFSASIFGFANKFVWFHNILNFWPTQYMLLRGFLPTGIFWYIPNLLRLNSGDHILPR